RHNAESQSLDGSKQWRSRIPSARATMLGRWRRKHDVRRHNELRHRQADDEADNYHSSGTAVDPIDDPGTELRLNRHSRPEDVHLRFPIPCRVFAARDWIPQSLPASSVTPHTHASPLTAS